MQTYLVTATYATRSGRLSRFSAEIVACTSSGAMKAARKRIGKRAAGKIDMTAWGICAASRVPANGEG